MEPVRPNFLIAGVAKAAKTSLYNWLRQHGTVFMPRVKEPEYIVKDYEANDRYWYLGIFDQKSGRKVIGEASLVCLATRESAHWSRCGAPVKTQMAYCARSFRKQGLAKCEQPSRSIGATECE